MNDKGRVHCWRGGGGQCIFIPTRKTASSVGQYVNEEINVLHIETYKEMVSWHTSTRKGYHGIHQHSAETLPVMTEVLLVFLPL
jgi:hypothetical protein